MIREYRMYGLVPYNISPIQQGIQFGHAVVEYMNQYAHFDECQQWARMDKTFIILNGGTTNDQSKLGDGLPIGTLNQHELHLANEFAGLGMARFTEVDLGNQLTAVVFLVDDRVWDKEKFPDFEFDEEQSISVYARWEAQFSDDKEEAMQIIQLRNYLKQFRLA